jgi:hypothetical protein
MVHHPLTDRGIVQFRDDWAAAQATDHAGAAPPTARAGGSR